MDDFARAFTDKSPLRQAGAITPITLRCARTLFFLAVFPSFLISQTALTYTGEPLKAPFECAEEELTQAGLVCTADEPCPIFLELTAIAPDGRKLFVGGNLHATSGTLSTVLLSSTDGGTTWTEPTPRIRGAAIEQLQFYDLDHGWAAGETQVPLPQDPFFLVTSDGGASWRQRPVTEEGGPGSLLRFWFDSAHHGELIVDAGRHAESGRYHFYESETGGESWMIRGKTGDLPKLKHAPASLENPDFRMRAGKTAYTLERRNGEKWETVAQFAIEVAGCVIKPAEVKPPQ